MDMEQTGVIAIASSGALVISIASFIFAVLSWRENHRPIVTARITTGKSGNVNSAAELVVENTGNRPALNIHLGTNPSELNEALIADHDDVLRKSVERCFDRDTFIPILEAGRKVTNAFGIVAGEQPTWKYKSILNVEIVYQDLRRRRFRNTVPIWLVDNRGFALGHYQ